MSTTTTELCERVCAALDDGFTVAEVEDEVLSPAHLEAEEHDALWLYAQARAERPRPSVITLIGN